MDEKQISSLLVLESNSDAHTLRDAQAPWSPQSFWGYDVNKGPQKQWISKENLNLI